MDDERAITMKSNDFVPRLRRDITSGDVWVHSAAIELNAQGHELFEGAPVLEVLLDRLTRYDAILENVRLRRPSRWLALNDDALGRPAGERDRLVLVPASSGLASEPAQEELRARLALQFPAQSQFRP